MCPIVFKPFLKNRTFHLYSFCNLFVSWTELVDDEKAKTKHFVSLKFVINGSHIGYTISHSFKVFSSLVL
jgi:hypothetical protein